MPAAGVKPDHFSFSATLAGCAKEHLNDDARALVELFRESKVYADAVLLRTPVNNSEYFPPNFEGLVLGCIDADFCK